MTRPSTATQQDERHVLRIKKEIAKRSFAVLATHSHAGRSHAAGVFVAITLDRRIHSDGLGVPILDLMRDPVRNGPRSILVRSSGSPA